jgi:hypothetical protein
MRERNDEKFCRNSFEKYLREKQGISNYIIIRGDEPPDYWLSVENKRFGIEVTQIVRLVEGGEKKIALYCYKKSIFDLTDSIEKKAIELSVLSGNYHVHLRGIPRYSSKRDKSAIISKSISYIKDTQKENAANIFELFRDGHHRIEIMKSTLENNSVKFGLHVFGEWQIESVTEALKLSKDAFSRKEEKLRRVNESSDGIILLILNRYQTFEQDDWEMLFEHWDPTLVEFFHSVFFISAAGNIIPAKVSQF